MGHVTWTVSVHVQKNEKMEMMKIQREARKNLLHPLHKQTEQTQGNNLSTRKELHIFHVKDWFNSLTQLEIALMFQSAPMYFW